MSSFYNQASTGTPDQSAQNRRPKWYASTEWPEWALVIVGVLTFIAVGYQGRETAIAAKATQKSVEIIEKQTGILERSVAAAENNAESAKKNIEMMIGRERPRIRIEPQKLKLGPVDDPIQMDEVIFRVFCYGMTPAFIVDRCASVNVTDSKESPDAFLRLPMSPIPAVFGPNPEGVELSAYFLFDNNNVDRAAISDGRKFVHFCGFIKYKDVFEAERITKFSYVWNPSFSGYWTKCGAERENEET
jgi:hypothetical protein